MLGRGGLEEDFEVSKIKSESSVAVGFAPSINSHLQISWILLIASVSNSTFSSPM